MKNNNLLCKFVWYIIFDSSDLIKALGVLRTNYRSFFEHISKK